jgi:hypothetical protein
MDIRFRIWNVRSLCGSEMGGACSTHGRDEKSIENFGGMKEATCKI